MLGDRTLYVIIQDESWKLDSTTSEPVPELKCSHEEAGTRMIPSMHNMLAVCVSFISMMYMSKSRFVAIVKPFKSVI